MSSDHNQRASSRICEHAPLEQIPIRHNQVSYLNSELRCPGATLCICKPNQTALVFYGGAEGAGHSVALAECGDFRLFWCWNVYIYLPVTG